MSTTTMIKPLNEHTRPFELPRLYGRDTRETFVQKDGDQRLLAALQRACDAQTVTRVPELAGLGQALPVDGRIWVDAPPAGSEQCVRVGELPEAVLEGAVLDVEDVMGGRWQLAGDEDEPILQRLDEHFRPLQEAHAEQAAATEALAERREQARREQEEEWSRAWRRQRILEMAAEVRAMDAVNEMRELLDESAAQEGQN